MPMTFKENRLSFHTLLQEITKMAGRKDINIYFQPPENLKMTYPCLIYKRTYRRNSHADNLKYNQKTQWELIFVDKNVDSHILDLIELQPLCSYKTHYNANNLNHTVFEIYH